MAEKLTSFAPVLAAKPKVLILGSMPGGISLEKDEYYGNPRNHFWDILFELFGQEPTSDYEKKIAFVKRNQLALWDTIGLCYREGSLDANIVDEEPNNIIGLLNGYPSIRLIACNGGRSYETFRKNFNVNGVDVIKLPSTSPIPGRYTKNFKGKVEEWKKILEYL
ncbi:G/U mismatch-specific uracil-DNA glycosylase [Virgibacillus subterraneus]|uniref:G/U mismatch-specific uracil-DNA glycosylase n=1 Tax=Virgibacillus subterraneus TaxID=621109 RepID=A0A1H9FKY0_9BACI|nr:DNA-deoxyinosine glycosylase [Virgibacillus subterraneus]SEQ38611.1 G/U mismatch-specific uracil-DNA glycosylase [Virgibacillus subterraneus]